MHPELDRVENLADLDFQIQHEIDLTEDGTVRWTKTQLHRAKMFYADVHMAAEKFALEYPELVDPLNFADGSRVLINGVVYVPKTNDACADCGSTGHNTGSNTCGGPTEQEAII